MVGTEKQAKRAEEIKAKFVATLWAAVEEANQRVQAGNMPPCWAAAVYEAHNAIRESVTKDMGESAKNWIKYRDRIAYYADESQVNKLADKKCPPEVRMPALIEWAKEVGVAE